MNLKGQIAVVTGSSRGIGKAIAIELASAGAKVVVCARTERPEQSRLPGTIHQTVEEIKALGGTAIAIKADLTVEEEVQALVEKTKEALGTPDILVNNAGIIVPGRMVEMPARRWDLIFDVNVKGYFLASKHFLPLMMEKGRGHVINMSSVVSYRISAGNVPYSMTKVALNNFTIGLAQEVADYGIAVNALAPDNTDTEGSRFLTLARGGEVGDRSGWQTPQQWGRYAVFLASLDPKSITGRILEAKDIEKLMARRGGKP